MSEDDREALLTILSCGGVVILWICFLIVIGAFR